MNIENYEWNSIHYYFFSQRKLQGLYHIELFLCGFHPPFTMNLDLLSEYKLFAQRSQLCYSPRRIAIYPPKNILNLTPLKLCTTLKETRCHKRNSLGLPSDIFASLVPSVHAAEAVANTIIQASHVMFLLVISPIKRGTVKPIAPPESVFDKPIKVPE